MFKKINKTNMKELNLNKPIDQIKLPDDYIPNDNEEFMNPMQLAYFRNKLLEWKNELLGGASDTIIELSDSYQIIVRKKKAA